MEYKYIKTLPKDVLYKIYNYLILNNFKCIECQEIIPNEDICIKSNNQIYCLDCFNKNTLIEKYKQNVYPHPSFIYQIISSLKNFFKK